MEDNKKIVEKVDNSNEAIQDIIQNAILNPEFKKQLLEDPDKVLDNYEVSEITRIMIKSLSEEDYDKLTVENISEYFAADSAIYTPDFDDSISLDYVNEDDI